MASVSGMASENTLQGSGIYMVEEWTSVVANDDLRFEIAICFL